MNYTWLLLGVVGCGGTQQPAPVPYLSEKPPRPPLIPELVQKSPAAPVPAPKPLLTAPLPPISIVANKPDLDDDARWPLMLASHPALEPHFDVARELAQPGITWTDLCARGLGNRYLGGADQELADYLAAWCSVERHDTNAALDKLSRLNSSHRLHDAIRADVADIVEHGDADHMESLLARNGFLRDDILDRIAAAFHEIGREADAYAVNQIAIGMDHDAPIPIQCHRLARAAATGEGRAVTAAVAELDRIVHPPNASPKFVADATCRSLFAKAACATSSRCTEYWREQHGAPMAEVLDAVRMWPEGNAGYGTWMFVVDAAIDAAAVPDGYMLSLRSIDMCLRTSACEPSNLGPVVGWLTKLESIRHDARFDGELNHLLTTAHELTALPRGECQTRLQNYVSKQP